MMRRPRLTVVAAAVSASLVAGCSAQPGPAPVVEPPSSETTTATAAETTTSPATTTTEAEEPTREAIGVGVQPLTNGFNPHLRGDSMSTVEAVADLVLPSPFRHGEMDTDLLVSATEIAPEQSAREPAETEESATPGSSAPAESSASATASPAPAAPGIVQTVRYVISPAAQWSDGTPITGADFIYLWRAMTSTPGVVDPAGYRAIANIRTSDGGRIVDVNFHRRVADWHELFHHLLPSHLAEADGSDFATAYFAAIPAAGGPFQINNVDRARGIITLHRNDRYWGERPAMIDVLVLREVSSVAQGVDLLRSGQVSFVDVVPEETSVTAYQLLQGTQVRLVDAPRQLQLTLSTASPVLGEHAARRELTGLIDVPLIARQAAGRSAHVDVPDHAPPSTEPPVLLPAATRQDPLRIAADPADQRATAAVRTLVDLLAQHDIDAELVATDLLDIAGERLPSGEVDAVVSWDATTASRIGMVSEYLCPPEPEGPWLSNLSGFCTPETDALLTAALAGERGVEQTRELIATLNDVEYLTVPLLNERRVSALGGGIVGPDPDLRNWPAGLSTADTWRRQD